MKHSHLVLRSFAAIGLLLGGCKAPSLNLSSNGSTYVEGTVWLDRPISDAVVQLSNVDENGRDGIILVQGSSNIQGFWRVDAASQEGPLHISASHPHMSVPLQAYIPWVSAGTDVSRVVVTPISHLAAAYARFLMRQRTEPKEAIERAQVRINTLFGDRPHHMTAPYFWPETSLDPGPLPMTDAVASALYLSSFKYLADTSSHRQGVLPGTLLSVMTVVEILAEDVEADGLFDGVGWSGKPLKLGIESLSGDFLRTDAAHALLAMVRKHPQSYGLGEQAVLSLARDLADQGGPLFNRSARTFLEGGPILAGCSAVTSQGEPREFSWPQHGVLEVTCTWSDRRGISDTAASSKTLPNLVVVRNLYVPAVSHFKADLTSLPASTHVVDLCATNIDGATTQTTLSVQVDPSPLILASLQPAAWSDGKQSFSVHYSSSKPLKRISGQISGLEGSKQNLEMIYDENVSGPVLNSLLFTTSCSPGDFDVVLDAEDWAGHATQIHIPLLCRDSEPSFSLLASMHHGDFGDRTVTIAPDRWPTPPPTFDKLYQRFDWLPRDGLSAESQNLPVVHFEVGSKFLQYRSIERSMVEVSYRSYLSNADEHLPAWRPWLPEADGSFSLPLAYQTLLPEHPKEATLPLIRQNNIIARVRPNDLHRLEIRVRDPLGHEKVETFHFSLHLKSPPVSLKACHGVPWLQAGSYRDIKRCSSTTAALMAPVLHWPDLRPPSSWAPLGELNLEVSPLGPVQFGTSEMHHWARWFEPSPHRGTESKDDILACWKSLEGKPGYHMMWEDGGCSTMRTFEQRSSKEKLALESVGLAPVTLALAFNRETPVAMTLAHTPRVAALEVIKTLQNHEEFLWKQTEGFPLNLRTSSWVQSFESLGNIWVTLPGVTLTFRPSRDELPLPVGIERDNSCAFTLFHNHRFFWAAP